MEKLFFLIAFLTALGLILSLQPSTTNVTPQHALSLIVDSRIELLAVIQMLSDYDKRFGLISQHDMPYKHDVIEYFHPYKDHAVINWFNRMSDAGFVFDAPPHAMLHLSAPPSLKIQVPFPDYLKARAGGEKQLKRFVEALRNFAHETQFMVFFKAHQGFFSQMVAKAYRNLTRIDIVEELERYYGMKQHSYTIILAPLFHQGGFGAKIRRADGRFDVYAILGPTGTLEGIPIFGSPSWFRSIVWHEFSHSFVNPVTERFRQEIAKYSFLYDPIAEVMKNQGYGDWESCVNEHIIRAIEIRRTYREIGKEAGDRALQREKSQGFIYIEALSDRLRDYEAQRDRYPTFVDFYHELIKVFKELSQKDH
uniref:Hypothetical conserved protein n=1 Tax=uncultured Acetothermia bacterium TaxID=236499 RepID=H5SL18_9BACT|nr:hypothetical conserved protein [uncultured Acetothermia bacterium]